MKDNLKTEGLIFVAVLVVGIGFFLFAFHPF